MAVGVEYLGFRQSPPQQVIFDQYWKHDWMYPGRMREEKERFFDLVATIRAGGDRLEPVLK